MSVSMEWIKRARSASVEWLLPTRCIACDVIVNTPGNPLCEGCSEHLAPIEPPLCYRCGCSRRTPTGSDAFPGGGDLCASCISFPPSFALARSCWSYEGPILQAWPRVKYAKEEALIRDVAALSRKSLRAQLADWVEAYGTLEVHPVPMHRSGLLKRGFHAPAKLLRHILEGAPIAGVEVRQGVLEKRRKTAQQAGLGKLARYRNLEGAFVVSADLAGATIVIFDDVYTTGATAEHVAKAALEGGADKALVLTMARAQR